MISELLRGGGVWHTDLTNSKVDFMGLVGLVGWAIVSIGFDWFRNVTRPI